MHNVCDVAVGKQALVQLFMHVQCLLPLWPPKCQQEMWKKCEIVQFLMQLHHFYLAAYKFSCGCYWLNLPTGISQPSGKIIWGNPLTSLTTQMPTETEKIAVRLCIFDASMPFSSCHLQNLMLPPWPNLSTGITQPPGKLNNQPMPPPLWSHES